jgi:adenosylhomocysteine nucleosidase
MVIVEAGMVGIIGAMEEEVELLRGRMADREDRRIGTFVFHAGTIDGRAAVLLRCGIGKVNAAVGCALLLETFRPRFVVNTGSAGGLLPASSVGDLVISDGLLQHDVDVTAFGYERGQVPGMPAVFPVPESLALLAEEAVAESRAAGLFPADARCGRGLIVSGDVFVHDPALIEALRSRFPRAAAVEMEGAAVAQACALFDTPFVAIRALSDIAGTESPVSFEEFLPLAAARSTEIVRRIVAKEESWKR